jgi:hypothetical protein
MLNTFPSQLPVGRNEPSSTEDKCVWISLLRRILELLTHRQREQLCDSNKRKLCGIWRRSRTSTCSARSNPLRSEVTKVFSSSLRGMHGAVSTASRPALGHTLPHIQRVLGCSYPGVKWKRHEGHQSPVYRVDVKNTWSYTSTPPTSSWCDASIMRKDSLFFRLPLYTFCIERKTANFKKLLPYLYHKDVRDGLGKRVTKIRWIWKQFYG